MDGTIAGFRGDSQMARFSVIIPVFAQSELLAECLRSLRASTFSDYELVVLDDGSPEPGLIQAAAAQFGARLIRSEVRLGSAAARNLAARENTGGVLGFI